MKKLLFGVNVGWFFVSHRLPVAVAARKAGYEVHIAAALDSHLDKETQAQLEAQGMVFHTMRLSRSGARLVELLRDFIDFIRLYRRVRPDVVHLVTLKPILLGGIAAKVAAVERVVLAVPGRGSVFSAKGVLAVLRRWAALALYRAAYCPGKSRVIVQNVEDHDYFISRRVFRAPDLRLIRGSGVDVDQFMPRPERNGDRVVVLASRMLKEKGVEDFVAAAALLKRRGVSARFVLVGEPDPGNPRSHSRQELESWVAKGDVEWWGFRSDMDEVFAACHVVCLPTYYGEGVPKVLIEAAACGRAIVTSDMPGCRDIVRDGHNGLLVKPRDVAGIANALESLLSNCELRQKMGRHGRELVESEFSVDTVIRQTLNIYAEMQA